MLEYLYYLIRKSDILSALVLKKFRGNKEQLNKKNARVRSRTVLPTVLINRC